MKKGGAGQIRHSSSVAGTSMSIKQMKVLQGRSVSTHRALRSRCVTCGFDRAGLSAVAVCPECGRN